jgi:hypothetical protein
MDEASEFFYQEMQEQSNYEEGTIDWDDNSVGSTDLESYDP